MHLVDGMTLEEVAREARLSVSGVRKRLRALKGRLAELEGV
jgi:DNA-directed RNA polymerase specialized sigma24 family protein